MKYPYAIKDWTNPDDYEGMKSFGWEFLRRNPEYQKDRYRYFSDIEALMSEYNIVIDQPLKYGTHTDYKVRQGKGEVSLMHLLSEKYSLQPFNGLPDPMIDIDTEVHLLFDCGGGIPMATLSNQKYGGSNSLTALTDTEVVICFDFSDETKLLRQLKTATGMLTGLCEGYMQENGIKRKNRRKHESKLPMYIRVLDALANEATRNEIAEILIPHVENTHESGYLANDQINAWKRAGEKFRDHDYLFLGCQ